eukprot:CAMPEP_0173418034 /NCGR_PEP_ID=MMETSP1357-20121228/266_1 /TAXON_ID=77926 /ORGANISM="Hemiselmis rufescens, Strain PCC563" /LENGTH=169 /DNA_ID=CAMNT_0014380439 /DNA_START=13 /DNA_END=522 /DNA_ORIENTATION=-
MAEEQKKADDGNPLGGVFGFFGDATKGLTDSVSSITSPGNKEGAEGEENKDFFGGLLGSIQGAAADAQKAATEAAGNAQRGIPGMGGGEEAKEGAEEKKDDMIGGFFGSITKTFEDASKGVQGMVPPIPGVPGMPGAAAEAAEGAAPSFDAAGASGLASRMADNVGPSE